MKTIVRDVGEQAVGRRRVGSDDESAFERHYSVEELAELWHMSDDFVRKLFLHEPGTVVFVHQRPGRRMYRTLRIPESVAVRVHRRMRGL